MIAGPSCLRQCCPQETNFTKIDLVHEEVNHAHRTVLVDPVFKPIRKKRRLTAVRLLDVSRHACLQSLPKSIQHPEFSHSLGWQRSTNQNGQVRAASPRRSLPFLAACAHSTGYAAFASSTARRCFIKPCHRPSPRPVRPSLSMCDTKSAQLI